MLKLLPQSSLAKIFPDKEPDSPAGPLSLFIGGRESLQFAILSDTDTQVSFTLSAPGLSFRIFTERNIPSGLTIYEDHDDFIIDGGARHVYPDCLVPLLERKISLSAGVFCPVWVIMSAGEEALETVVKANVSADSGEMASAQLPARVIAAKLPPQDLRVTMWFHSDSLINYYDVPVFSEEYWRITANYVSTAVAHGINMILTPIFTPPLDTEPGGERPTVQLIDVTKSRNGYIFGFEKLDRWLRMCLDAGVEYFEMSDLFTQWGARHAPKIMAKVDGQMKQIFGWKTRGSGMPYRNFLTQLAPALTSHIDSLGLHDRCFFHVSDEPNKTCLRAYTAASRLVHELFGGFKICDALSDFEYYKRGLVTTPYVEEGNIEAFVGNVPELLTYYCCGQFNRNLPNRFFCMPSLRNRILGVLLYKYNCAGFLQWGYDFWFTRLSKKPIDPYQVSDAGGEFPSGDSYVVYPAPDGTPYCSLRLEVFSDAIDDVRALRLLEKLDGRESVLSLIKERMGGEISFTEYPHEDAVLLGLMAEVKDRIALHSTAK